ncbi:family 1 glycosylhydrolase [Noviherbaspirillum galbum]|uniref:Family 1 glycosylhydrolase n=1 Tax=Noviherbaspirillum galbum TaxID=2709383 RepID=A0A6B3SQV6_9BURK|nr:family 1 glycosylhydrolase [Noviherbaspirillum galbum]NEX62898.1 family 1 glycosylhydrolase [Noviherbaspirillum galbum]
MQAFLFATGIENSYPTISRAGGTLRVDEMAKTGHYGRVAEDLRLAKDLGIDLLRYGPPYYLIHAGPGTYHWEHADEAFNLIRELGIAPCADLCHFGVPDWLQNFQNPDFPAHFAEYAGAFAQRYPWVRLYTPINEMYVTAHFSAQLGLWNECLSSDRAFVTATRLIGRANILATEAILKVQPSARFIQSESSEYFHPADPDAVALARRLNERRFLSLDLCYGYDLCATTYEFLLENGMRKEDFRFFMEHNIRPVCIMGNDYYATNEHIVHPDGRTEAYEMLGYYVITKQYYDRYRLPVMHTETNNRDSNGSEKDACSWLKRQWGNLVRLKEDGVPIIGFTWYSLIDQVDWDSLLVEDKGSVNELGLYDLQRRIRPVGLAYRDLIQTWRGHISNGMLSIY